MSLPVGYWHLANQLTGWPSGRDALLGHESDPWKRLPCLMAVSTEQTLLKLGELLTLR